MNEYRLTRNWPYCNSNPTCTELRERQGYYITARTEYEARLLCVEQLKTDKLWYEGDEAWGLTCQLWKSPVSTFQHCT